MIKRHPSYNSLERKLLALGIAQGGASISAARGGEWVEVLSLHESPLRALIEDWVEQGRIKLWILSEPTVAVSLEPNGGKQLDIDEPLLDLQLRIPDWVFNPAMAADVPYEKVLWELWPYHRAVEIAKHSVQITLGYALGVALREGDRRIVNTSFEWNTKWPSFGAGNLDAWTYDCEALAAFGIRLTRFEQEYLRPVAENALRLGLPRSAVARML